MTHYEKRLEISMLQHASCSFARRGVPACRLPYAQHDSSSSFFAGTVLSDGSLLVAGYESDGVKVNRDFAAFKLNPLDGSVLKKWKASSHLSIPSEGGITSDIGIAACMGTVRVRCPSQEPCQSSMTKASVKETC